MEEPNKNDKLMLNVIHNHSKEMRGTIEFIGSINKLVSAFAEYGRKNYQAYEQQRQDYERRLNAGLAATDDFNEKIIFLEKESIGLKKIILNKKTTGWKGDAKFYTSVLEDLVVPLLEIIKEEAKLEMRIAAQRKSVTVVQKIPQIIYLPSPATPVILKSHEVNLTASSKKIENTKNSFGLSWDIDPKLITGLVDLMIEEKCFRSDDRSELINIFHGLKRNHTEKIVCTGLQKRLPTVFFELEERGKINSQKKEIAAWIAGNFTYQAKPEKSSKEFSLSSLNDILNESKPQSRLQTGHKQYINVLGLLVS